MSWLLLSAALASMQLVCSVQTASTDGESYVGPKHEISIQVGGERASIEGGDVLGLDANWLASRGWHGSVELKPQGSGVLVGHIIPRQKADFGVFWANTNRLKPNGAPTTQIGGSCRSALPSNEGSAGA